MNNKIIENKIIVYEGGGYSGCFWEPNFALLLNGVVLDVMSSGSMGLFRDGKPNYLLPLPMEEYIRSEKFLMDQHPNFYPLTGDGMRAMFAEYRVDFCLNAIKIINKLLNNEHSLDCPCNICGKMVDPDYCLLPDECGRGDGGIGIIIDTCICSECYSIGSCVLCGSYIGADKLKYGAYCSWCYDTKIPEQVHSEIEKLELIIERGTKQLSLMIKLNPKFAEKYTEQHGKEVLKIKDEIQESWSINHDA